VVKWGIHGAQGTTIGVRFVDALPSRASGLDSYMVSQRPTVHEDALPSFAINLETDPDPTDRTGCELVNELQRRLAAAGYVTRIEDLGQTIGFSADGGLLSHWVVWVVMTTPIATARAVKESADAVTAVLDLWDRVTGEPVRVGTHEHAEAWARSVLSREWSLDGSPLELELESRDDDGTGTHCFAFVRHLSLHGDDC
jgi:hypothetical protein